MKGGNDEVEERGEPVEPLRVMIVPVSPAPVFSGDHKGIRNAIREGQV